MALMVDSFTIFQPHLKKNKLSLETSIVVIQMELS
jgi:hypothetical protein